MLNRIFPKARIYDFRGVIVDNQGNLLENADLRLSCDDTECQATPILICTEPRKEVMNLARRLNLADYLTEHSIFSVYSVNEKREPLRLESNDFISLSRYLLDRQFNLVDTYITTSLNNVGSANRANSELRKEGVKKSGHLHFNKIGLLNQAFGELEEPRTDGRLGHVLYVPIKRIMTRF